MRHRIPAATEPRPPIVETFSRALVRKPNAVKRSIAAASLLLLLFTPGISAQEIQLQSRVELVVVPVSVKGKNDRLVGGLTQTDFAITESGKRQTITNFSIDPVPISAAILVDTGISELALTRVKDSFPALMGAFAEEDELAIYRFGNVVEKVMDFTDDRFQIENVFTKLTNATPSSYSLGGGPFSAPGPIINGAPVTPGVQPQGRSSSPPTKLLHDAVFAAAEDLGTRLRDRRRIMLIISDGRNQNSRNSYDGALNRLLTNEVQVFSVGVDTSLFQRIRSPLSSYAKDTGGEVWFPESQAAIESCYFISTEEARNQYVLGYQSSNKRPSGQAVFREIKVAVSTKGLEVRHRKGYYQSP